MNTSDVYYPNYDLGEFRHAVAAYGKYLIRARWRCEPGFLTQTDLDAWGLEDIDRDRWPAWQLLHQAAVSLAHLNSHYLPRCGSGGIQETDQTTPEGRLIFAVAGLVPTDGGGPAHNAALLEASRQLREGKILNWGDLVVWDQLESIRADLDQLPHPQREAVLPRLERIEAALAALVERQAVKDWYTTEEAAKILGKAEFTTREWCRQGRVRAAKKGSGRGKFQSWVISHAELLRIQKEGLLPPPRSTS